MPAPHRAHARVLCCLLGAVLLTCMTACGTGEESEATLNNAGLQSSQSALTSPDSNRYIVKFRDAVNGKAAMRGAGGTLIKDLGPQRAAAALLTDRALAALRSNPHIEFIEEDPIRKPLAQAIPYGIDMVQAPLVWGGADGAGITVCIIDSGIYVGHEDIQLSGLDGYPAGWNNDGCGHGTHVAGTIAALDNTVGVVGVLPHGVDLFAVQVFGADCSWTYASDLVDALNRCQGAGAKVVSMSLGGSRSSQTELDAFSNAYAAGILSVAAAGNDGTTRDSYPASYTSVISVAAIDSNQLKADFSQYNAQVELSAPGVAIRSTVPWGGTNTLTVNGGTYTGDHIEFAALTDGTTGALVDGGLCDSVGAWSGKVVLCERGDISFFDKVANVQSGGGIAAAIYNNEPGNFMGTLGSAIDLPAISLSQEDGQHLVATELGNPGTMVCTFTIPGSGYEAWDGTSMATPHVSGVAALVWSHDPAWTNDQIRSALQASALDLGAAGRDNLYGFGLIQARAALDYLGGGNPPDCSADGTCNPDCAPGADPDCVLPPDCSADGTCNPDCAPGADPDCASSCGDGVCDGQAAGEDCSSCPADCDSYSHPRWSWCCGDGTCGRWEVCPIDCP